MTFEAREESVEEGAPVELYVFRVYSVNYYYTSAGTDQVVDAITYQAFALDRSQIDQTDDTVRNDLTIKCPLDFPILQFFESAPPSDVILLTVKRFHREDSEVVTWWNGRVVNGNRDGGQGILSCENVFTSLKRMGLRRLYSRLCPHVLYGAACRAVEIDHRVTATVDGVNGDQIDSTTFATFPDGRFSGGFIEFEVSSGRIEKRGIKTHVGSTITLTHPLPALEALDEIFAFPGCKHTLQDCNDVFANVPNYGGFPFVPKQNPMGSSSVF